MRHLGIESKEQYHVLRFVNKQHYLNASAEGFLGISVL
jgi:predicted glycosyltransferase